MPPRPGDQVRKARRAPSATEALFFDDDRPRACRAGSRATTSRSTSTSTSSTAPRAPTSTSAASPASPPRRPTPPSCSTALFHSGVLGAEAVNTKALIFNVKGEDLLFLDHPNTALADRAGRPLRRRSACPSARSPASACSPRRGATGDRRGARRRRAARSASRASSGRSTSSASKELLPFLFADAEDDRQQYTMVVAQRHRRAAAGRARRRRPVAAP